MADLRCPMCSKPNSDTRETCQYCGARLRPLVLPMTGELNLPDDWIKTPPAAETPAQNEQPAAGGDDWLGSLRNSNTPTEDDSFDSNVSGNPVDDWLAKLRAQDEAEDASQTAPQAAPQVVPQSSGLPTSNWLNNPGNSEETFVHRPAAKPKQEPDLPDWMRTDNDDAPPAFGQAAEPAGGEPALPDWLSSDSNQGVSASSNSNLPDWMRGDGGNADDTAYMAPPSQPAQAPQEDLPSWLSGGTDQTESSNLPDWMRTEPDQPSATASDLPDWLNSAQGSADETFVRPPKPAQPPAEELPAWLSSSGSPDDTVSMDSPSTLFPSDRTQYAPPPSASDSPVPDWLANSQPSTPDWLSSASGAPDDTVSINAEPAGGEPALPSWLSSDSNQGVSASSDLPDWLSSSNDQAAPAAPAQPATPTPPAAPELPDWLSDTIARTPSGRLRPPPAEPVNPELPDWLRGGTSELEGSQPAPAQPPASTTPPGRAVEGITDWLAAGSDASAPKAPAESEGQRPLSTTGWLRSITPTEGGSNDLDWLSTPPSTPAAPAAPATPSPAAPSGKSVTGATDWLANSEGGVPATGDLPDWLASAAPAPSAPAASKPSTPAGQPPASKDKSVVGATDWFASTEGSAASGSGTELPDWLKSEAPSAPANPPASSEKAMVGSTDWLANSEGGVPGTNELPDWLKGPAVSAASSQGTPPPVSNTPPPASSDKAVVGSTDWLANTAGGTPGTGDLPDWLKSPNESAPASGDSGPLRKSFGTTDWLNSLGSGPVPGASVPGTGPLGAEPTAPGQPRKPRTGWLTGPLKAPQSADQPSQPAPAPAPKAILGATDWLDSLAAAAPTSGTGPLAEQANKTGTGELPDWLGGTANTGTGDLPDWVGGAPAASSGQPAGDGDSSSVGTTDWLKSLSAQNESAPKAFVDTGILNEVRKNDVSDLDWLSALQPASPSAAPATPAVPSPLGSGPLKARPKLGQPVEPDPNAEAAPAGDLPAWLAALKPTGIELPTSSSRTMDTSPMFVQHVGMDSTELTGSGTTTNAPAGTQATSADDLPDWIKPPTPTQPVAPARPAPAAPAPRGKPAAPFSADPEETMVSARTMPGLSAAPAPAPSVPAFSMPIPAEGEDLVSGNLPGWMRALRPLDARATAREPEPDHEETAGPLAGMRGILPAESVITMAGKPGASVVNFVLTDAHTKRAERLRRLVQEEGNDDIDVKPHKRLTINFDVWRLLVALLLLVLAFVPFFQSIFPADLQAQLFSPPPVSLGVQTFASTVDKLQAGQVAVVAVEYEPGYRGELDPAVQAVLVHLLQKKVRVVVVSSSPTGAGVADDLIQGAAVEVSARDQGKDYINLGFIPGGPAGLRQFALSPFSIVHNDFSGNALVPADWADLASLDKVGLVIVASNTSDGIQNWLQQVQTQLPAGKVPFVAVSSAAAEPLVSPYAGGKDPQLAGVLTGLSGAIQYNSASGRDVGASAPIVARWFSFGLGLYAIAGLIVVGALVSVFSLFVSRRPAPAKAGTKTRPAARTTTAAAPVAEPAPAPEPLIEEPTAATDWDPTAPEPVAVPAPAPAPKKAAPTKGKAPAKKAPPTKTSATKGKASTAAGKAAPVASKPKPRKPIETRVAEAPAPAEAQPTETRAKPRMRKV